VPERSTTLPVCVPGYYETVIVTDPGICGPDPRCGLELPRLGGFCQFPGLACEFNAMTIACDCGGVAHCVHDPNNIGARCPDAGTY
jgi:hypothetical protein